MTERKTLDEVITEKPTEYAAAVFPMSAGFKSTFELHFKRRKIFSCGDSDISYFLEKLTEYCAIYSPFYEGILEDYPQVSERIIKAENSPSDEKVTTKIYAAPDGDTSTAYVIGANDVVRETTAPNVGIPSVDELTRMREEMADVKRKYLACFEPLFMGVL